MCKNKNFVKTFIIFSTNTYMLSRYFHFQKLYNIFKCLYLLTQTFFYDLNLFFNFAQE